MIPVLAIPHFNRPDLLLRCIASLDHEIGKLVITQNGPDSEMPAITKPDCVREIVHIKHPNAGVAGSWNEIIMLFPADWWMLLNNDVALAAGDLQKLAELTEANKTSVAACYGNHGASWWTVTEFGVSRIGVFDENLHPAYLEDCDWSYRRQLLNLPALNCPDCHAIHGDGKMTGSCTIQSNPEIRAKNHRTHGRNFDYYRAKWGGNNGEEKFRFPFNKPNLPVDYWKFDPKFRKEQQW